MGRALSIIFYLMIAIVTCVMALQVGTKTEYSFVNGRRTRESLCARLFLGGIFTVLFVCSALRFGIGNDYGQYTQTAHEAYVGGYVVTETGFNVLVRLIYGLVGFECYELVFAVFAFATIYIFLKAMYRQSVSFGQSFFLFMTLGFYFQTYNTVRYYLALAIALYSMRYVLERDWIKFVFVIVLASFFHKSVLLVLPVYWLASFEWKRIYIIIGAILSAVCFACKDIVLKLAIALYPSYKSGVYFGDSVNIISVFRIAAVIGFYFWFMKYSKDKLKRDGAETVKRELYFYGQLNILAFAVCTFFYFLPVVTRIAYYFSVSQLLMIPLIISLIDDETLRRKIKVVIAVICVMYFAVFLFQAHGDGIGLLPYRSWLFTTERYTYN